MNFQKNSPGLIKEKISSYLNNNVNSVDDSSGIGLPESYVKELIGYLEQNPAAFGSYIEREYDYLNKKIMVSCKRPREYGFHKMYIFKLQRALIENLFFQLYLIN